MFKEFLGAAALTATLTLAHGAGAATMQATLTGTVYSSYDLTGLFGAAGGTLDGLGFSLTYVYDTALGGRYTSPGSQDQVYGGTSYNVANPTISARLSIAGNSQSVGGSYSSVYSLCNIGTCGADQYDASVSDFLVQPDGSFSYNTLSAYLFDYRDFLPDSLDTAFRVANLANSLQQGGYFQFLTYDAATQSYPVYTTGYLMLNSLSVSQVGVAPVPLPASALMLLAGTGGLGALKLRRRRRRAA